MNFIKINGVIPPVAPRTYKVSRADLDSEDTTRNENGVMKRYRVRAGVYKIFLTYRMKVSDLAIFTNLISNSEFPVEFFDLTTASTKTANMYAGDREAEMFIAGGENWVDFSVNLIQL